MVNKILSPEEREKFLGGISAFKRIILDKEQVKDVKNIANGVYSPLHGFLKKDDFQGVVSSMRLKNGVVWPIPIVLDIDEHEKDLINGEKDILLSDAGGNFMAVLKDIEIFDYDKEFFVKNVFGTDNKEHPGVDSVYKMGKFLVGGETELAQDFNKDAFQDYNFSPAQTRKIFQDRGWNKIVAFQTRNVPHSGHEFLQKYASKNLDGLFIQPVIGEKKLEDSKDEYILACYEVLIDRYFDKNKVVLGILPLKMRYAGPREAVLHALIRKNFGCSHFIVGRDHAGIKNYYPPFAAQEIFNNFKEGEIGIEILKYPEVVFCPTCNSHVFADQCSHAEKISFSGTLLREKIKNKEQPPHYLMRPEVYYLLSQSQNSLVDSIYKNGAGKKGFVCWFTGLPSAGKTTVAQKVFEILKDRNMLVEMLDGDDVRQSLAKDLGFSRQDRDENIKRISFVSKLLSKNGVGVIASFVSPYKSQRDEVRSRTENFIEIFCAAPLEVCEKRDAKGLYAKARRGEIKNFTGVSDPYENPESPEIILETHKETVEESVKKVIQHLEEKFKHVQS